jgi:phage shock protein PspC (stress-responsive transcriptional regulator)
MNSTASTTHPRPFRRSSSDKIIAGVAGGLGEYFSVDPVLMRVGLVVATFLSGGLVALAYIALVILRPTDAGDGATSDIAQPVPA